MILLSFAFFRSLEEKYEFENGQCWKGTQLRDKEPPTNCCRVTGKVAIANQNDPSKVSRIFTHNGLVQSR